MCGVEESAKAVGEGHSRHGPLMFSDPPKPERRGAPGSFWIGARRGCLSFSCHCA